MTTNPYTSSSEIRPPTAQFAGGEELDLRQSVKFIFENPNWLVNIACVVLCMLAGAVIPILPGLVLLGYQFELLESLAIRPVGSYPDFKFDRLVNYLARGLYPFVVCLLGALAAIPVMLLLVGAPMLLMAALMDAMRDAEAVVAIVMVPIIFVLVICAAVLINLLVVPMMLRAGISQDIGSALNWSYITDFARKLWKDMILAGLFMMVVAIVAEVVGLLLFCIGVIFTCSIMPLVQAHLGAQLYRIYLSRGGEKFPLKSTPESTLASTA